MKSLFSIILAFIMVINIPFAVAEASSSWIVTQYSAGGTVGMFYSMVNQNDGIVILIDGGWAANADQVKQVIDKFGGYVDYWILTHYHEDHCGAFNALWPEYRDKIGTIYVTPLTWNEFEPYCNDWDTPDTFKLFLQQTEGDERITPLHRGDRFEINGLRFDVFNSWDKKVLPITTDIANNCSLVFKIQSKDISVLFFSDIGDMGQYLVDTFGAEALHADYVQAGHHGWGIKMEVYDAIQPGEMLIDAEDVLLNSEEYAQRHGVLVRWCQNNNVLFHSLNDTPYSIIVK